MSYKWVLGIMPAFAAAMLSFIVPETAFADDRSVEICDNDFDDDGDGDEDEAQCQEAPTSTPISGDGIVPELWNDNPSCSDMGYQFGFKIANCPSGTYPLDASAMGTELTGGAPPDDANMVTIACQEGNLVDWESTLAMDAVFVKGGPLGGNLYVYDPEDTEDTGLSTPNAASGISHIEFCYDYELDVDKTAAGSFERVYTWTIQKDYNADYDKNIGDDPTIHGYQVVVDQTVMEQNFAVTGSITIDNNTPLDATIESVADVLDDETSATVDCGVTFPYLLAAGGTLNCSYTASPSDDSATLNTATVTTSGSVGGGEATDPVEYTVNVVGDPTVNVDDTNGESWTNISADAAFNYTRDFVCPTDESLYVNGVYEAPDVVNTATIAETGQSDTATVSLTCYAPVVTKTADASLTREYEWTIEKTPDATYNDFIGDPANNHDYSITVTKTGFTDSNWTVSGQIFVQNPGTLSMPLSAVTDNVNGVNATVTCESGTMVPAGMTLTCTYTADEGLDGDENLNTATATLNGIDFSGTADVTYVVGEEINAEVNVTDSDGVATQNFGPIGDTTTLDYSKDFQCPVDTAAYTEGFYTETRENTATIDETEQSDNATVTLNCYAPVVTKDAAGSYDERHTWTIEKLVDPTSQNAFFGDPVSWTWTVKVDESFVEENWMVTGSITVANGHPTESMTLDALVDSVDGVSATVDCASLVVPAGDSLVCSYTATEEDGLDGDEDLNIATATFNSIDFSGQDSFAYQKNVINETATVEDDQEPDFPLTLNVGEGPWEWTESDGDNCSSTEADYEGDGIHSFGDNNTATLKPSDAEALEASASTTVTCYAPLVTKDASGSYDERHTWTITKTVDPESQSGFAGDTLPWTWTVEVSESSVKENFAVSGTIYVNNPVGAPGDMTVSLTDALDDGTLATVDCGGGTSVTVAAGAMGSCSYTAAPANASAKLNTATGMFNGGSFVGTAPVSFTKTVLNGTATLVDDEIGLNETLTASEGPWMRTGNDSHVCADADTGPYGEDGTYSDTVPNTATVTGSDGQSDSDDASTTYTCQIPARAKVVKSTTEGPEDIGQFPFTFELYNPSGQLVETQMLSGPDEVFFATELRDAGTWTVKEVLPDGWVKTTPLECTFPIAFPESADQTQTCTFDNVEKSRLELLKLTNGVETTTQVWNFGLNPGPDGFADVFATSASTPSTNSSPALLTFGDLDPLSTYTLCELGVPASFSSFWQIDTDGDMVGDVTVIPYNPNADDEPPEDLGNRCVDIGPQSIPLIELVPGTTLHFVVDNQSPGGAPRTPGYWKNWNTCTGGGQQYTAASNGGWQEGFWLLEDVLDPTIGGGIVWDDILTDDFVFTIDSCQVAVDILDKREVGIKDELKDGKKKASDPLHNLATHLLAAQLNFGAGACTTQDVLNAALMAEELLDKYDFDGDGYNGNLKQKGKNANPDAQLANDLASYLDMYNNGEFCGDGN